MWISDHWKDYEVLDTSDGEKLERWGRYILVRPDPQVIWQTARTDPRWKRYDARYVRSNSGGGRWSEHHLPERWQIGYGPLSFIYAMNKQTGEYEELQQIYATENRIWADLEEIPENLINAAVAIEDKRFFEHQGVDWRRTISACGSMFFGSGGDSFGGSTITQQLIKNLTGDDQVTVRRKLQEIFRALQFEKKYTKEEIIEWYLNTIYLGEGAYGVKSAANVYFAKSLDELTLAECASLIGITNNPSLYDPYIAPEENLTRRNIILQEMRDQGLISEGEYVAAHDQELRCRPRPGRRPCPQRSFPPIRHKRRPSDRAGSDGGGNSRPRPRST